MQLNRENTRPRWKPRSESPPCSADLLKAYSTTPRTNERIAGVAPRFQLLFRQSRVQRQLGPHGNRHLFRPSLVTGLLDAEAVFPGNKRNLRRRVSHGVAVHEHLR